jgi:hypothetical protein
MANPWIQQIAKRLDDLQPVNGSYVQAIAQLLNQLPNTPGQSGLQIETTTTSTGATIIYDAETVVGDVGQYVITVIGKRGNEACFTGPTTITLNTLVTPQIGTPTVPNGASATIPFLIGSDNIGDLTIFSDAGNNTFRIIATPSSATSTIWKVKVDFVKIP